MARSTRRRFLAAAAATLACPAAGRAGAVVHPPADVGRIRTVLGTIRPEDLGLTLCHEHVMVDFIGASKSGPHRYDRGEVVRTVQPHLERAAGRGVRAVVECTPKYLARDPRVLRTLSTRTGMHLLTNTGWYGARQGAFLPARIANLGPDEIAGEWIDESRHGLDGTSVRPGFVKIGVNPGPLHAADRKLITAAARCHLATGLTILSHTGRAEAAFEQLDVLAAEGVHASAFAWVHAQAEPDSERLVAAARRGAWISLDGVSAVSADLHLRHLRALDDAGLSGRVLLSHDAGWYRVGEPAGGRFRPYEDLFTVFPGRAERAGFDAAAIARLMTANPADAFTIRVRPADAPPRTPEPR